jgi:hypothetical protein
MSIEPNRAGGCEWLGNGIRVQYARCWACMLGQCPGGNHPWADADDIEHAKATGQPDPSEQKCGCVCADGPELTPDRDEPEWESLNAAPCTVCGSAGACGTDPDGNDWAHIEPYEDAS